MTETAKTPKTRRWKKLLLIASLGLNLLFIGTLIGNVLGGHHARPAHKGASNLAAFGPYGRALPKEDRKALMQALRQSGGLKGNREAMRKIGQEVVKALRQSPFDKNAVDALLAEQTTIGASIQQRGREILVERFATMTPEQRAAVADHLENTLKRGFRKDKHD